MEEVWKDLAALTSLQQATTYSAAASSTPPSFAAAGRIATFQDLLLNTRANPDGGAAVDRLKRRMIKNRESAARSRARKQAYTSQLEKEVDHLQKENKILRRQAEELRKAMADHLSLAAKSTLQRTLTAPF